MPQTIDILVQYRHARAHANRDMDSIGSHHAGTDHHDMCRRDARDAPEQQSHAAMRLLEVGCRHLD